MILTYRPKAMEELALLGSANLCTVATDEIRGTTGILRFLMHASDAMAWTCEVTSCALACMRGTSSCSSAGTLPPCVTVTTSQRAIQNAKLAGKLRS